MSQMTGGTQGGAPKIKIKLPVKVKQQPAAGDAAAPAPSGAPSGAPPRAPVVRLPSRAQRQPSGALDGAAAAAAAAAAAQLPYASGQLPEGLVAIPLGSFEVPPGAVPLSEVPPGAIPLQLGEIPPGAIPLGAIPLPIAPSPPPAAPRAPKAKKAAGGGGAAKRKPRAGSDPDFEEEAAAWAGDDVEDEDFVLDMNITDDDLDDDDDLPMDSDDSEDGRRRRKGKGGGGGGGSGRKGRRGERAAELAWGGSPASSPRALRPQRSARAAGGGRGDEAWVNPLELDFEALDREAEAAAAEAAAKPKAPKQPRPPKPKKEEGEPAAGGDAGGGGGAFAVGTFGDGGGEAAAGDGAGGGATAERKRLVKTADKARGSGGGDGDYAPSSDEDFDELDLAMEDNEEDEDFDVVLEEELTGSRRGRRPASGVSMSRGRGRGRKAAAAAAALSGGAGGAASSGGGRSRRSRRVAAKSGATGGRGGGDSFMTGSGLTSNDDEWSDDEDEEAGGGELFGETAAGGDFRSLSLKPDHANRPLWVCPDGRIFLETFSPVYKQAYDFLIAVAEPVCRPESVHEYVLTPHSLYAAVSVGLETSTIIKTLNTLSKVAVSAETARFIRKATQNYGKAKMVLKRNKFWVESAHKEVLDTLLADPVVADARTNSLGLPGDGLVRSKALRERAAHSLAAATQAAIKEHQEAVAMLEASKAAPTKEELKLEARFAAKADADAGAQKPEGEESDPEDFTEVRRRRAAATGGTGGGGGGDEALAGSLVPYVFGAGGGDDEAPEEDPGREVLAFEVLADKVEVVKKQCLPPPEGRLNYPLLEEYDFRADAVNPTLPMELKPHVSLRPYQEKSLGKMFGNGRARSGIIVLPCGAGKSLVGVAAAARVKKSCLCLCTSSVSVDQWRHQFMLWSNLREDQIIRFTSEGRDAMPASKDTPVIAISTFTMISHSGKRSEAGEAMMRAIREREWGLLLLDEVHVVPAAMFRKVIGIVKAHCKLGLTATLVREDERIGDLNFLIGPKLYEANWLDLTREGHIANVQCVEVWCPMAADYMRAYLQLCDQADEAGGGGSYLGSPASKRQLLYAMNPNKFFACQFLVWFHETHRNDKIIVFSDNIFALRKYAILMKRPFIYGGTSHQERTRVLHRFKTSTDLNTVFLSKVGDNSLDIPEANVLIQISSHAGSRRQEAQRLGRILRAKKGAAPPAPGEFDAYFYTLVSRDTQEMFYSAKRQQFLIDQGYAFKVVESLHEQAAASDGIDGFKLLGASVDEQRNMLSTIMEQGATTEGIDEILEADQDQEDLVAHQGARRPAAARRAAGSLAAASGADRATYNAWAKGGGRGGGGGRGRGKRQLTQAELERRDKSKKMRSKLAAV